MEKQLARLISYDTTSNRSNLELVRYCQAEFTKNGYFMKLVKKKDKANLFACRPGAKRRIVLSAHTDTVPKAGNWKTDPYKLTRKLGRYYGLGLTDMKGFIATMLEISKTKDPNLGFLLTFDEETDFAGAKLIKKNLIRKNDILIIGEATNAKIVTAHKGIAAFEILIEGKGGHGSEPEKGISAIIEAAKFIVFVKNEFNKLGNKKDTIFKNPNITCNFGTISGGSAINKIPETTRIEFESRVIDKNGKREVLKILKSFKSKAKIRIKEILDTSCFKAAEALKEEIKKSGIETSLGVSYATEAAYFCKLTENILIFGPGDPLQAHSVNESIKIKELDTYFTRLEKLLESLSI